MKNLLIILITCISARAFGQNDTVTISKTGQDAYNVNHNRIYKLFIEEKNQEIKHLFKLNIIGLNLPTPLLSYEQKIGKMLSCETSVGFGSASIFHNYSNIHGYKSGSIIYWGYYLGGFEMLKFYHNLNRRQRLDKNINGFAGNYFAIQFEAMYLHEKNQYSGISEHELYYRAGISYGIQRRIGNIGYFEPSFALNFSDSEKYPTNSYKVNRFYALPSIELKIGFAIDSFSNLKRMLN